MTSRSGCPIRKSPDQSLLPTPRGLSQSATSFIASRCQGIHQMPLLRLRHHPCAGINPDARTPQLSNRHLRIPQPPRQHPARTNGPTNRFTMSNNPPRNPAPRTSPRAPTQGLKPSPLKPGAHNPPSSHPPGPPPLTGPDPGGGERIRTDDLLLAKQALSQLSYTPKPRGRTVEKNQARFLPPVPRDRRPPRPGASKTGGPG